MALREYIIGPVCVGVLMTVPAHDDEHVHHEHVHHEHVHDEQTVTVAVDGILANVTGVPPASGSVFSA